MFYRASDRYFSREREKEGILGILAVVVVGFIVFFAGFFRFYLQEKTKDVLFFLLS